MKTLRICEICEYHSKDRWPKGPYQDALSSKPFEPNFAKQKGKNPSSAILVFLSCSHRVLIFMNTCLIQTPHFENHLNFLTKVYLL
jgi:hypothetical protein